MSPAPLTVVIGAGISGLTCAYALKKAGENVLVLEAGHRAGGVIQSIRENGFLCELGPQSFTGTPQIFQICDELGITSDLIEAPRRAPRYIWLNGRFVPVPMSPVSFFTSSLLNWRTKLSILTEVFRTSSAPNHDESVAAFVRSRFTQELLDRLVGPFVSGIYAGDPELLSLRAAFPKIYEAELLSGSVIRGSIKLARKKPSSSRARRPGLCSFRHGNETLTQALADFLGPSLRLNTPVASGITRDGERFVLSIGNGQRSEQIRADKVVLATPAGVNAELLSSHLPSAARPLNDIPYAAVAVVSHGFRSAQVARDLRGFGFLVPRTEEIRTLGSVWNSSLFPDRAPAGHILVTSFVSGRKSEMEYFSEQESAQQVRTEISQILGISGEPVFERVTNYFAAIPQYNVGHTERLQDIRNARARVPGLFITGNYWDGPSIGACVENSLAVAEQVRMG